MRREVGKQGFGVSWFLCVSFSPTPKLELFVKGCFSRVVSVLWERKNNGFEGNGEVGERSCGEQQSCRVPGMILQAAAGAGEEQSLPSAPRPEDQSSHPCSPQGAGSCSLLAFPAPGKGLLRAGVSHKRHPPPQQLGTACTSCLVGWPGRLLNRPLFMGFSSARHANHLIP